MPQECKIGTLYFGYPFFCRLVDGIAYIYHTKNDTQLIGKATKMTDIRGIQKKYFENDANSLASLLYMRRKITAKNFGKCEFEYGPEVRAFKRVMDKMYENFDPAHDWVQEFKDSLDIEYDNIAKAGPED